MSAVLQPLQSQISANPVIKFTKAATAGDVTITYATEYGIGFSAVPTVLSVVPRNAAGDATAILKGDPTATAAVVTLAGTGTVTVDVFIQGSLDA